jgi:hypothetical protein
MAQQRRLLTSCDRLKLAVGRLQLEARAAAGPVDAVTRLGTEFTRTVETMLSTEIAVCVRALQEAHEPAAVKKAVETIAALAVEGNHLCRSDKNHDSKPHSLEIPVDCSLDWLLVTEAFARC